METLRILWLNHRDPKHTDETMDKECIPQYLMYNNKNPLITAVHRLRLKKTIDMIHNHGMSLDAGCGDGFLLEHMYGTKIGMDLNVRRLKRAKKRSPKSMLICCDITKLPFKNNIFSTVVSIDVLEHVKHLKKAIEELKRVTDLHGEIIIAAPEEKNWEIARKAMMQKPLEGHINNITVENLEESFGKSVNIKRIPFDFLKVSLWKVLRFIKR